MGYGNSLLKQSNVQRTRTARRQYDGEPLTVSTIPNWLNSSKDTGKLVKAKSPSRTRNSETTDEQIRGSWAQKK